MLCQLSYRGRQRPDCSRALRRALREDVACDSESGAHASLRRRRRRGVHWRPRVRSQRGGGQCSRRRSPDRASCPRVRSWSGRRRARADDEHRRRRVPAEARDPGDGQGGSRHEASAGPPREAAARPARARGRRGGMGRRSARVQVAALRPRLARRRREVHTRTGVALRRYQLRRGLDPRRDRRSADVPLACGPRVGAGRLARRRGRERASSRSPRAIT